MVRIPSRPMSMRNRWCRSSAPHCSDHIQILQYGPPVEIKVKLNSFPTARRGRRCRDSGGSPSCLRLFLPLHSVTHDSEAFDESAKGSDVRKGSAVRGGEVTRYWLDAVSLAVDQPVTERVAAAS